MKKIDILNEVYTEKQRRWACWQMDAPKSEREISKYNATEMCKDVKRTKKNGKSIKPKMKKKDLVEYINKKIALREDDNEFFLINEMNGNEKKEIFKFLNALKFSGVINMHGSHPILCWTREDLERWLYGNRFDIESLKQKIEDLEYEDEEDDEEGDNEKEDDGRIERIQNKIDLISYMLDTKDDVRDILISAAMERAENTSGNLELNNIQRIFEKMAAEAWKMWAYTYLKLK